MSLRLANAKKIISTHGESLLRELSNAEPDFDLVISYIEADPVAGRLKQPPKNGGNNSYHLLLGSNFQASFVLPVLRHLLSRSAEGVRATNVGGSLPLHLCLAQPEVIVEAAVLLINSYPESVGIANQQGLIPLFLCVMRNNPSFDLCKLVCKTFPAGPSTKNKTESLPLHFAVNRDRPNRDIVRMLLRRHAPAAAVVNRYGLLPLHCAVSKTDDLEVIQMLLEAHPEAICCVDRQGRTCLHLAVMAMGRDHEGAVSQEEAEEKELRQQMRELTLASSGGGRDESFADVERHRDSDCGDEDDDEDEKAAVCGRRNELLEREGRSRRVIRYLIDRWPQALVTENNFQATPAETVLEKARRVKNTKSRKILVYGLFDDPPTARMLLAAQKFRAEKRQLPPLRPRLATALRELNWLARRDALLVSFFRNNLILRSASAAAVGCGGVHKNSSSGAKASAKSSTAKGKSSATVTAKTSETNSANGSRVSGEQQHLITDKLLADSDDVDILKVNILARLRRRGLIECVRLCVSWI